MARWGRRTVLAGGLATAVVAGVIGVGAAAAEGADPPATAPPTPAEVDATQRALDARAASVPDSVVSWGVDPAVGLVVVEVSGTRDAAVDRFVAGLDPRTFRVATGTDPVRPLPGASPTSG